jgi:hypothetical protein
LKPCVVHEGAAIFVEFFHSLQHNHVLTVEHGLVVDRGCTYNSSCCEDIYIYIHIHIHINIYIYIYVIDISNYVYLELYMQGKQQCGIFGMASTPDEKKSRLGG